MGLLYTRIEFHTLFKLQFYKINILMCQVAFSVKSIYLLSSDTFLLSNKEQSSVSLLTKYQILFRFLKSFDLSGAPYLKYPMFVFTKNLSSRECLYISGYSSGSFLIFFKTPRYKVFYVAWYTENTKKSLYCMEISLPIDFPDHSNLFQ